jgi:hypothetical protein
MRTWVAAGTSLVAWAGLTACGGNEATTPPAPPAQQQAEQLAEQQQGQAQGQHHRPRAPWPLPQLAPARPGTLNACSTLPSTFAAADTAIDAAADVAAGELSVAGNPVGAHCVVTGRMHSRTGSDGQPYAIGFEMRLPQAWNGRFYYQANGGADGNVVPAIGSGSGGGPLTSALLQGFAVISSDAGHTAAQTASFGFEPQARLDYGYQATQKLTPMAKALIAAAYGRGPDRSYFGGCSNGGRHTLVATTRLATEYDGFLAGNPGFNLPQAAVAQVWGTQQYARAATPGAATTAPPFLGGMTLPDLGTAFTAAERATVAARILNRCDALDGAADGIVGHTSACQRVFRLERDVPTCSGARDGSCLTALQKQVIGDIHAGARTSAGTRIYTSFPYDPGMSGSDWATWEFIFSVVFDPLSAGTIFSTPPVFLPSALTAPVDTLATAIFASDATYTESGMQFMTPPNPADLSVLRNRGAKVLVFHGVADAVFSYNDTVAWYWNLAFANGRDPSHFARLFPVPGMNHCAGGPATDQFDLLAPLVRWVEQGQAPDAVVAAARGPGNAGGANPEVPANWAANRTRPLCPYPKVARYKGSGSLEDAASFACR